MSLDSIAVADDVTGQPLPGQTHDVATEEIAGKHYQKMMLVNSSGANLTTGLVPIEYDYISLGYTGSNLTTVIYKTGGSGGTTVATLTLSYTGSQLDSITKT